MYHWNSWEQANVFSLQTKYLQATWKNVREEKECKNLESPHPHTFWLLLFTRQCSLFSSLHTLLSNPNRNSLVDSRHWSVAKVTALTIHPLRVSVFPHSCVDALEHDRVRIDVELTRETGRWNPHVEATFMVPAIGGKVWKVLPKPGPFYKINRKCSNLSQVCSPLFLIFIVAITINRK